MKSRVLKSVPTYGSIGSDVVKLKDALRDAGFESGMGERFDDETLKMLQRFQKSKGLPGTGVIPAHGGMTFEYLGLSLERDEAPNAPWLGEANKDLGKKETDKAFSNKVVPFWKKVGLSLKGIVGSWQAWCGVSIAMWLTLAGFPVQPDGAGAKNWAKYGHVIQYKVNGIPKGAIISLNHTKCGAGKGNHVTLAKESYAAEDFMVMEKNAQGVWVLSSKVKPDATFVGRGGNQGNMVKDSNYPIRQICSANWPKKDLKGNAIPMPGKVLVSTGKGGKANPNESTR